MLLLFIACIGGLNFLMLLIVLAWAASIWSER